MRSVCICTCVCFCVGICCELLFAVHAVLSEALSEGVGVDLQLCDLKATKEKQLVHLLSTST